MDDDPQRPDDRALPIIGRVGDDASRTEGPSVPGASDRSQTIALIEETAVVSKRRVVTGSIRIETRTELRQESTDVELDRQVVDITRVPVNRLVERAPEMRTEGDTTIVPVVEERCVVVKQFFLKEELHIRHRTERETFRHPVALRRQYAVVERFDSEGRIIGPGDEPEPHLTASSTDGA